MRFWIIMFLIGLIFPFIMINFGYRVMKNPPEHYDRLLVYRTGRSMRNSETWAFAHRYIGDLCYKYGIFMFIVTFIIMILVRNLEAEVIGIVGGIICATNFVLLSIFIIATEKKLDKTFDNYGNKRQ